MLQETKRNGCYFCPLELCLENQEDLTGSLKKCIKINMSVPGAQRIGKNLRTAYFFPNNEELGTDTEGGAQHGVRGQGTHRGWLCYSCHFWLPKVKLSWQMLLLRIGDFRIEDGVTRSLGTSQGGHDCDHGCLFPLVKKIHTNYKHTHTHIINNIHIHIIINKHTYT